MIEKTLGPTIVYVCESTAHCSVYQPTDTLLNQIVDLISKSNYVCDVIYDEKLEVGKKLAKQVGGEVTDIDEYFEDAVDKYS